jgi:hypothetical protein
MVMLQEVRRPAAGQGEEKCKKKSRGKVERRKKTEEETRK